jgi:PAS domain S-box-containing protein
MPDGLPRNSLAGAIVETITEPLLVLDGDLRVEAANPAFLRHFGVESAETLGCLVYDLGNGQWNIGALRLLLEEVLTRNGKVVDYRVEHDFESLGERIMLLNANRMRREGATDTILLAITDITERERRRFELEGEKEFAEKLIDSVRECLVVLGWDLRVQFANQSFYNLFAVRREETEGRLIYELGNGQWDIPELRQLLEDILPKENSFDDYEMEHRFETIGRRIMLLNARRLERMNLILLAIRDVTGFEARLDALARGQDLLVTSPSGAVNLRDIIRQELEAVGAEAGRNFTVEGPPVRLAPREALSMAMTIHELTTNAAKYGALKPDNGRIEIRWRTDRRNDRTYLTFEWRESGVLIEDLSPVRGFGSNVIERSFPHMLGGTAELTAACRLEFPLPA